MDTKGLLNKIARENEDKYKESSKQRLLKIIATKIKTSFIGSLDEFEKSFGVLWGHGKHVSELTEEEHEFKKMWDDCRKQILTKGNDQIRAMEKELQNNDIEWTRFNMKLPVKPI